MIIDAFLILDFLAALWIGWSMRIYLEGVRILGLLIFVALIRIVLPFFVSFVEHSSANISPVAYYIFGTGMAVLIFLCIYTLMRTRRKTSSGMRRFVGSLTLAVIASYSLLIVLLAMADSGWIDLSQSILFSKIPDWLLSPWY